MSKNSSNFLTNVKHMQDVYSSPDTINIINQTHKTQTEN